MTEANAHPGAHAAGQPLLRVEGLVKTFPGLTALDNVSLEVNSGEIVAVIGHNGSGKSTLVKILAGVYTKDTGEVELLDQGEQETEIHFIHQDLGLIMELTAVENLNLARGTGIAALERNKISAQRARARELISRFGEVFDVNTPLRNLTPAQRAIVAIARALDGWTHSRNIIVLDEPTEALAKNEVDVLFSAVRRLAAEGAGVIFISHRLDEVLELADRVVVLRDGQKVADEPVGGLDQNRLVELVTGASIAQLEARRPVHRSGEPVLHIRGLHGTVIEEFDLDVYRGEIVGIAGVLGSGREEVPALLFGSTKGFADEFVLNGQAYLKRSPDQSIRRGMGFVPGDRGRFGSIRPFKARENMTLPQMRPITGSLGMINARKEKAEAEKLIVDFEVRPPRAEQTFSLFSGGNQQKIVLAKWLRNKPSVLLLEEPTQGVDIGAKSSIYEAVDQASEAGTAVIVCSSDSKELLRMCDRVLVLRSGRVAAELSGDNLTEHRLVLEGYGLQDSASAGSTDPSAAAAV